MQFNSLIFAVTAPLVILLYYAVPKSLKTWYLLLASLCFYSTFGIPSLVVLCAIILVTIISAKAIHATHSKPLMIGSIALLALLLSSIRFMNRAENTWFGFPVSFSLFVPVGLSFFTLNAIGYLADLYTGKIDSPLTIAETGVFLSFFPIVTSGPILRASEFAETLRNPPEGLRYERIRKAFLWVLWGYFMKLVIAERCALFTAGVYGDETAHGFPVMLAIVLYSLQIYTDFAGYSMIAKGLAYGMGITVPDNFQQPYLSSSVKEFWRRWHMSLSRWLKDYVYIPLGGSRKGKWTARRNVMITFIVSGFWHGTGLTFLVWGALHGLFQILEGILFPNRKESERFSSRLFHIILTFVLVSLAWVFFRSNGIRDALSIFQRVCIPGNLGIVFTDSLYSWGLDARNFGILALALVILCVMDVRSYRSPDQIDRFLKQSPIFRLLAVWVILAFVILSVNLSGAEFIYMQF